MVDQRLCPARGVKVWLELKRPKPLTMDGKGMIVPQVLFMLDTL